MAWRGKNEKDPRLPHHNGMDGGAPPKPLQQTVAKSVEDTLHQQHSGKLGSSPKKSFVEAVRGAPCVGEWDGHPGDLYDTCWENKGSNVMEIKALDFDIKWLEESFIGEMHSEDDVPRFIKMINEEGRLKCLARPIKCISVLMSPSSTLKVEEALKDGKGWLHRWCSFIRPWKRIDVSVGRKARLWCYGMPLHIWNAASFTKLVNRWGKLFTLMNALECKIALNCNINKDKLRLSDDSSRTTDYHWTNSFIPDSIDRSQNDNLDIAPQVMDGKAEDEKSQNSIFSLHKVPDLFPLPNTMVAQPLEGKIGACKDVRF
ncbi:hypothetical protein Ancab_033014 [Ancistrocladus abbreviatus]